ncbi:uncharacterized protein LOC117492368 isoform X1 [Trematomus bernacchii]|uniref:uncharacterized protein LOC117492368 isoform X1 n=1 Tax=Trematomus bernacchii TaxID=40690 RepID=UPI00146CFC5B|nr:uncharacterized protein LOC117492368 isoform X1 [Trematomus bernacchii]XP_033998499.1 uncharacterized protein LOC117492368 isoform X1 [Trematomus bernacchii]
MMKISGRVTWCCVALLLALTSVSAVQKTLKSIIGLKKINFGQSVPKHSLLLLHWFANEIDIDNNNIIQLTFDPNSGDYGSHHYGNYEDLLDPLPQRNQYHYYTIGNLHQGTSNPLPAYVAHPGTDYDGENRDRIIVRVREQNRGQAYQTIDEVYITQHYDTSENQGTPYDPDHTYSITPNLLRQIREFAVGQNQLSHLRNRFGSSADEEQIRNTWGPLACLGLLLYIVIQEKHSKQQNNRPENRRNPRNEREHNVPRNERQHNVPRNEREHNVPRNEREHNVPRNVQNQGYVAVNMGDYEDRVASSQPVNTESDCCNTLKSCIICFGCCFACIILIVLGIIIYFFVIKK